MVKHDPGKTILTAHCVRSKLIAITSRRIGRQVKTQQTGMADVFPTIRESCFKGFIEISSYKDGQDNTRLQW